MFWTVVPSAKNIYLMHWFCGTSKQNAPSRWALQHVFSLNKCSMFHVRNNMYVDLSHVWDSHPSGFCNNFCSIFYCVRACCLSMCMPLSCILCPYNCTALFLLSVHSSVWYSLFTGHHLCFLINYWIQSQSLAYRANVVRAGIQLWNPQVEALFICIHCDTQAMYPVTVMTCKHPS